MRKLFSGLGLLVLAAMAACGGGPSASQYYSDEELMNQVRSLNYQTTYDTDSETFVFEHEFINVSFTVYYDRTYNFGMMLENKTDQPVTISWNGAEYIDVNGYAHSVIHQDVHFLEPVTAQTPTQIAPYENLQDLLKPADRKPMDGAMRFVRAATPIAGSYDDQAILVIPMKVLGHWTRRQYAIGVGAASPTAPPEPYWE